MWCIYNLSTLLNILKTNKLFAFIIFYRIFIPDFNNIKTLIFFYDTFGANTDTLNLI